jgi:hypothetical protein
MMKFYFCLVFCLLLFNSILNAQRLFINEFMASNSSAVYDPDFNIASDWIEIFNADSYAVNLKGYFISDDPGKLNKYAIPNDLFVNAGGFIVIWNDDRDTLNHTNFKLSRTGGSIILSDPYGLILDSVNYNEQREDISFGRFPDGGSQWVLFSPSTPAVSNSADGIYNELSPPLFSLPGGFYGNSQFITLSHPLNAEIRFTTDGTEPSLNSNIYKQPFFLDTTSVISVKAFKENYIASTTVVNSYLINFHTDLPLFSIVTDPANFFSDTAGIYVEGTNGITGRCVNYPVNWNQDWERPINLEFYESDKSPQFNLKAGVKIFGGCTRKYAMKSLAIHFRSEYGKGKLDYPLFSDLPVISYDRFLLRSSSQDWWRTMFRDGMIQTLIKEGMNIEYQEYRPSVLFLNGVYWGIHNIREKMDAEYLNARFGVDENNVDLILMGSTGTASDGDMIAFRQFVDFYSTKDLSVSENYEYINSLMDVDQYIDYQIAEIFPANADWPGSNTKLWRTKNPPGKFRWLLYDIDMGYGGNSKSVYNFNTLEFATAADEQSGPNKPWATLLFRKLLENQDFRNEFIQRTAVHMNTTFNADHVLHIIDSMKAVIASEIPRHKQRWPESLSIGTTWDKNVEIMREFAQKREAEMHKHYNAKFNLAGTYSLVISRNNPSWGKIFLHSVELKNNRSINNFFKDIPLRARAAANPGYRFVRWEGVSNSTSNEIVITTSESSRLTAVFEKTGLTVTSPVVNEINYKSSPSFDSEDWIELHNPAEERADISGWIIRDDEVLNKYVFPPGSFIEGNGYIVVCRDTLLFNSHHNNIPYIYGNLGFGLNNNGDMVLLYDQENNLIDSVSFGSSGDWTSLPNGNGPTLSLINSQFDNSLPLNWKASGGFGTPGRINDTYVDPDSIENNVPALFILNDNYPNPFNNSTIISFSIPQEEKVSLKVYDLLGREVFSLINERRPAGSYTINFQPDNMVSGIYFYRLQSGNFSKTKKMIFMK